MNSAPANEKLPHPGLVVSQHRAFISYSHGATQELAASLQKALQTYSKPWYKPRLFRIFRDTTNLSVTPELWPEIERALQVTEFLILLASPQAAASKWVKKELEYWINRKPPGSLMLVLTKGDLVWDDDAGDFDFTLSNAIPETLRGVFKTVPRWADFSKLPAEQYHLSDPLFLENVASISAQLQGKGKEDLIGDHVRETRRILRHVTVVVCVLTAVLLFALGMWQLAAKREHQVRVTLSQSDFANAHRLLAQGESHQALLHLVRAVRQNPENSSAMQRLTSALTQRRWPVLTVPPMDAGGMIDEVALLEQGKRVLAASPTGGVSVFDTATGARRYTPILPKEGEWTSGRFKQVAVDEQANLIATYGEGNRLELWSLSTGEFVRSLPLPVPAAQVEFLDNREKLAVLDVEGGLKVYRIRDDGLAWQINGLGRQGHLHASPDGKYVMMAPTEGEGLILRSSDGHRMGELQSASHPVVSSTWWAAENRGAAICKDGRVAWWDSAPPARSWVLPMGQPLDLIMAGADSSSWYGAFGQGFSDAWRVYAFEGAESAAPLWTVVHPVRETGYHVTAMGSGGLDLAPDHRLMITQHFTDRFARVWKVPGGAPACEPLVHDAGVRQAKFMGASDRLVTATSSPWLRLWQIMPAIAETTDTRLAVAEGEHVYTTAQSADGGKLAVVTNLPEKAVVRVFEIDPGRSVKAVLEVSVPSGVSAMDLRADGNAVAWVDAVGGLAVMKVYGEQETWKSELSGKNLEVLKFLNREGVAQEDSLLVAGEGATLWCVERGQTRSIDLNMDATEKIQCAAVSPSGRMVAVGNDAGRIWQLNACRGTLLSQIEGHDGAVQTLGYSADGGRLCSGGNDYLVLQWKAGSGESLPGKMRSEAEPMGARYSPDGRYLVTYGRYPQARIWDAATGQPMTRNLEHDNWIVSAQFSEDSQRLVTCTIKGGVRFWECASGLPVAEEIAPQESLDVAMAVSSSDGTRWFALDRSTRVRCGQSGVVPSEAVARSILDAAEPVAGMIFNPHGGIEAKEAATSAEWMRLEAVLKGAMSGK
ncbi:TIR domain-containing protein [Verrucomicrobium sp. BvORR106]|uniref:toll/interleukin-1 receptor domain-containing protein n=1 Tax=Verrucomicrobium sp. BvORR106 TaxID=1403819 RepID=UPI000571CDF6|nr:TIR domain-containing protein [Verrucomicrobium sp. BvORR106]